LIERREAPDIGILFQIEGRVRVDVVGVCGLLGDGICDGRNERMGKIYVSFLD